MMRPLELAREEEQDVELRRSDLRWCLEEREEEGGVTRKKMKMKISESESVNVLKEERVKAMPFLCHTLYNMAVVFLRVTFSLG